MTTRHIASLCLLAIAGCAGDRGIVGSYDTSDTGNADTGTSESGVGCLDECDPDFAIAHLTAINLFAHDVHLFATGNGTCEGDRCPASVGNLVYDGQPIVPCEEDPEAIDSPLGAAEHCRISPLVAAFGFDVGFTTPVERASFEELGSPLESDEGAFLWRADVVAFEGPGTAFRGDYPQRSATEPQSITNVRNLTCIERLATEGVAWTPATLDALCSTTWDDGGTLRPRRMAATMELAPPRGRYSSGGASCDTPDGTDTCCSSCDYELSVAIAKYGVTATGERRDPATAIGCDPQDDVLASCRDFVPSVDRSREDAAYVYAWDGAAQAWTLPIGDKLRETHPDDRPAAVETVGPACAAADECAEGLDCLAGHCRVPWTVGCVANPATTGDAGYCVDLRFDDYAAAACFIANADFGHGAAGDRLSSCDVDGDGMEASECCDAALGGATSCDPLFQSDVTAVARYDRDPSLAAEAQCTCDDESAADPSCADTVATWCAAPLGAPDPAITASPAGAFAARQVASKGGVRWKSEEGVMDLRIADAGGQARASAESCAESRGRIPGREAADRWFEEFLPERLADHELALCSGSTYRIRFAGSDAADHLRSEAGGTLDGRDVHVFETAQFRIIPNSHFPSDNLTISACEWLSLRFSNKYDLSATNLRKVELRDEADVVVAGGATCSETATAEEIAAGAIPCLTIDLTDLVTGELSVAIDPDVHGVVLQVGQTYHLAVPGLADIAEMADADAYAAAFHDACGMPLVLGDTDEVRALFEVSFSIDSPCM